MTKVRAHYTELVRNSMHPMLNIAIKAARRAGAIINRASLDLKHVSIARKGAREYVTEVDRAAEQAIVHTLQQAYPEHAMLGEEYGLQGDEAAEFCWVIDPLDGTTNFIHGFPHYAVSLALMQRGVLKQAVIYDPSRNEMFTATRGSGAFLNDRRIRTSGCTRLHEALLGAHWPSAGGPEAQGSKFQHIVQHIASLRRLGATVLDLAYVACGRLDAFCGVALRPWDMAAGSLLVLEAGGLVADFAGEQRWLDSGNILAATPKLFATLLNPLQAMATQT